MHALSPTVIHPMCSQLLAKNSPQFQSHVLSLTVRPQFDTTACLQSCPMYATFRGCNIFTSHQSFGEHLHTQEVDNIHQVGISLYFLLCAGDAYSGVLHKAPLFSEISALFECLIHHRSLYLPSLQDSTPSYSYGERQLHEIDPVYALPSDIVLAACLIAHHRIHASMCFFGGTDVIE